MQNSIRFNNYNHIKEYDPLDTYQQPTIPMDYDVSCCHRRLVAVIQVSLYLYIYVCDGTRCHEQAACSRDKCSCAPANLHFLQEQSNWIINFN